MRILLIEDDHFLARRIKESLAGCGLTVTIAQNVQEAIKMKLNIFRALLIDVMLPNDSEISGLEDEDTRAGFLSGVALAKKIREKNPTLPIILISSGLLHDEAAQWAKEVKIPFVSKLDGIAPILDELSELKLIKGNRTPRSFIIHGHDEKLLKQLKNYIKSSLRWRKPIVLRETPNLGKTLIEKFEDSAFGIDVVFVLLTPDDKTFSKKTNERKRRARQNVIFELGFFYGQFGRRSGRVIVLTRGPIELPSDIYGVAWINVENGLMKADREIRREIGEA